MLGFNSFLITFHLLKRREERKEAAEERARWFYCQAFIFFPHISTFIVTHSMF